MKILLINPPFNRLKGYMNPYYPIGLGYLCAVANDIGVETKIYNADAPRLDEKSCDESLKIKSHKKYLDALNDDEHYVWKEIRKAIADYRPDIVGISCITIKFASAMKISKIVKSVDTNIKVLWGGPHPTICTEEVIKEPLVDFVIFGEGEGTFKEFLMGTDPVNIRGLAYKRDGEARINPPRGLTDLDSLPQPDRVSILFPERFPIDKFGAMITMRGCPFDCGFCSAKNIWSKNCRYRSIDKVIAEIKWIKDRGVKHFYLWDDSFSVNRKRAIDLCNALIPLKIDWACTTRVDLIDYEILSLMKKSGCSVISIGIESGSERILKIIHKNITTQQVKDGIRMIKKAGIRCEALFMMGFPDETEEDIKKTLKLAKELEHGNIILSTFTPYPGSSQFDVAKKYGLLPPKLDWSMYSHQSVDYHFVRGLPKEKLEKYVNKFLRLAKNKRMKRLDIIHLLKAAFSQPLRPDVLLRKCRTFLDIVKSKI